MSKTIVYKGFAKHIFTNNRESSKVIKGRSVLSPQPKKTVYVINYAYKRVEEAILMGFSQDESTAWVKTDTGTFNEMHETSSSNVYYTVEHAHRELFKAKLKGKFKR